MYISLCYTLTADDLLVSNYIKLNYTKSNQSKPCSFVTQYQQHQCTVITQLLQTSAVLSDLVKVSLLLVQFCVKRSTSQTLQLTHSC